MIFVGLGVDDPIWVPTESRPSKARPATIREQADHHDMVMLFRKLPASQRELFLDEARRDLTNHCESVEILPDQFKQVEASPITSPQFSGSTLSSSAILRAVSSVRGPSFFLGSILLRLL